MYNLTNNPANTKTNRNSISESGSYSIPDSIPHGTKTLRR